MGYTNKRKRDEYSKKWYRNNREQVLESTLIRRKEKKEWVRDIKTSIGCQNCPENDCRCLEFHHMDPTTKDYNITRMVNRCFADDKIMDEIQKCIVLCANCHRKLHFNEYEEG